MRCMMEDVRGLIKRRLSFLFEHEFNELTRIMNIPKIKEDESLAMWRVRLAREFNLDYKMQELIREVSVTSYIRGTDVMLDTLKKEGKIRE